MVEGKEKLDKRGSTISAVDMTHVLLKDDDDSPTETVTVAVVTQGTSRGEEHTGNTHDDNSTQGATATVVSCVELSLLVFSVCSSQRLVPCVTTVTVAPCVELSLWVFPVCSYQRLVPCVTTATVVPCAKLS
jgi:hypothetical protein